MSNIAIKVENLSKAYQLGQIGTGTISRDLERWYARIRGKEDPFLRIGETNDRSSKGTSNVVWSLKDINFEIEQGDAVGIIGRNGAGKSTLLKILSKVTAPTTGKISGKGRIASLLEVGTGFHPELSGRENIFLNGAILGMRKKEIARKLEEIVDFAGIERYLDTPVKRYSSGMYVRLAFAVAAHLESEILIVDEVLAVGDAEFQKKCLGKMGEVSKGEGRTVLFVSHNMGSIKQLCSKGLVLGNGELAFNGDIFTAVNHYVNNQQLKRAELKFSGPLNKYIDIIGLRINRKEETHLDFPPTEDIVIEVIYKVKEDLNDLIIFISLFNDGYRLFTKRDESSLKPELDKIYSATFNINKFTLRPASYTLALGAWGNNETLWSWSPDTLSFKIEEMWSENFNKSDEGIFNLDIRTCRSLI
ncbi:ATP-binding cassette domain-containing protein [Pedobacter frigiditerrae]|uniref:ATP-binding cassette domain-containing protein n=1 Tax=Pedobacter frigiditerrae TaxID=2530452 RepID=A0A4R0MY60_9SPHI|nr:ABC transporter ATP-binding protein [Pedobacter frigiditerrae]TCC92251.1 ATP-binding cassette domain-containing protein [Pedobacter frigiditerrae]